MGKQHVQQYRNTVPVIILEVILSFSSIVTACMGRPSLVTSFPLTQTGSPTSTAAPSDQATISPDPTPSKQPSPLPSCSPACQFPSWQILFRAQRADTSGDGKIDWQDQTQSYTMNADGSGLHQTGPIPFIYDHARFRSPDGEWTAVSSGASIQIGQSDGSVTHTVPLDLARIDSWCWAPDSQELAVGGIRGSGTTRVLVVYRVSLDGSQVTPLLEEAFAMGVWDGRDFPVVEDMHWAADDVHLFFVSAFRELGNTSPEGEGVKPTQLYRIDLESGNLSSYGTTGIITNPRWSPDDRLILYTQWEGPEWGWTLWLMGSSGGRTWQPGNRPLLVEPTGNSGEWSPDGCWIVFASNWDPVLEQGLEETEIFLVRVDGTELRRLTNDDFADYAPVWIP